MTNKIEYCSCILLFWHFFLYKVSNSWNIYLIRPFWFSPVNREEAARDIIDVEREYCSQLWSLLEDYMNPLRDETVVSRREFQLLFPPYIPQLYEHHCILLRKMEERLKKWKTSGVIGNVFAKFTESQEVGFNAKILCCCCCFFNKLTTIKN